jgi:hypothetical protein
MVSVALEGDGYVVFGPAGGTSEPDQLDGVDLTRLVGGTITQTGTGFSSPILSVTSLGNKLYSIQVEGTLATLTGGSGIGLTITVDPLTEKIWTFGTDGDLTTPGNIFVDGESITINGVKLSNVNGPILPEGEGPVGWLSVEAIQIELNPTQMSGTFGDFRTVARSTAGKGYDMIYTAGSVTNDATGAADVYLRGGSSAVPGVVGGNVYIDGGLGSAGGGTPGSVHIRTGGNNWVFSNDSTLTFPDGGSLRISTVPTTSKGQPGDEEGMMAFDNNYIYRCVLDHTMPTSFSTVSETATTNEGAVTIAKSPNFTPATNGWTVTIDGVTADIIDVIDSGDNWVLLLSEPFTVAQGTPITVTAPQADIWKRLFFVGGSW